MEYLTRYLQSLWSLCSGLWFYFLIGFLLAGLVAEFIPKSKMLRYLGKNNVASLLRATLAGTIATLCSCGAIPIAVTLRKRGATKAAALTFMLAAPWAGFIQLAIFYKFLGGAATFVVFAGALCVAFLTGSFLGLLENRGWLAEPMQSDGMVQEAMVTPMPHPWPFGRRFLFALQEAWEAFRELWKYLGVGLLLAAAMKAFVPLSWVARYLGESAAINPIWAALPMAVAVELCSEGFSIFAGQLHQMGATLAVVFVVTLVGVTTDLTELIVIYKKFGRRCMVYYLLTATTLTLLFAFAIQPLATILKI